MGDKHKLSGTQYSDLQEAILSGYPGADALRAMVKISLEEKLDQIAGGSNLKDVVFNLTGWAERNNRVADLLAGAFNDNPDNAKIRALARRAVDWACCVERGFILDGERAYVYAPPEIEQAYLAALLEALGDWAQRYTPLSGTVEVAKQTADRKPALSIFKMHPALERYEELGAAHPEHAEPKPVEDLRQAVTEVRRLVVLGEPGAGKTATLWRLVYDYADEVQNDPTAPIPLLAPLGSYTGPEPVFDYLAQTIGEDMRPYLLAYLHRGRVLLLLDGLNEMPRQDYAERVSSIQALLNRYPRTPAVVTCRTLDYKDEPKLEKLRIKALDVDRQRAYLHNYLGVEDGERMFWQLMGDDYSNLWVTWQDAGGTWDEFWRGEKMPDSVYSRTSPYQDSRWASLRAGTLPPLLALGANPLMLFMLYRTYQRGSGELPKNRGQLFADFVESLLEGEHERCGDEAWPGADVLRAGLTELAYAMQVAGERGTAVSWDWAVQQLPKNDCGPGQIFKPCAGATLLDVSGGQVRFFHQLIQEYFAALAWDARIGQGEDLSRYWPSGWLTPTGWEETAVLLAGIRADMTLFVEQLLPVNPPLAARCIAESGGERPGLETVNGVQTTLVEIAVSRTAPVMERNAAGDALNYVGDPRPGVGVRVDGLPAIVWCKVTAGEFVMGESPSFPVKVDEFSIGKYPITNIQYQAFIDDGGYTDKSRGNWTQAGWEWKTAGGISGPRRFGGDFDLANHPVVGVSWYEAVAFCNWLTVKLGKPIMLANEAQWEKAARGTDGRRYPWGTDITPDRANYVYTGIGSTSAVGIFPKGESPYGLLDALGNVWEWTGSQYQNYPYADDDGREQVEGGADRTLRGGSFSDDDNFVRCAIRRWSTPGHLNLNLGFRVLSPGS